MTCIEKVCTPNVLNRNILGKHPRSYYIGRVNGEHPLLGKHPDILCMNTKGKAPNLHISLQTSDIKVYGGVHVHGSVVYSVQYVYGPMVSEIRKERNGWVLY